MGNNQNQLVFVCSSCGEEYLKWQGKCENCRQWNTLREFKSSLNRQNNLQYPTTEVLELSKIKTGNVTRIKSGVKEFDRTLGGGIVPGSIMILGGDPGIGKSTLLLQIAAKMENVLYVSGEESAQQIKMRFDRLNLQSKTLKIYSEINLKQITATVQKEKPNIVIIDSIQTIYSNDYPSTPGSIVQVRECALRLQQLAKVSQTSIILVGHVTKEGTVAGPRTLEHLVDVVLFLEGDRFQHHRLLRGVKNRFGAIDEIGIFEMTQNGLEEVLNPSKLLLSERIGDVSGTVVTAMVEGSRAMLLEVQALTATTVFGYPQRKTSGFDLNRLQLIIAVLQKRAGINLSNQDVFINIVGGIKVKEPAVDLAVALAVAGSYKEKPIDSKLCIFGEIGLSGEIRNVTQEGKRKMEAKRLGFTKFVVDKKISEVIRRYYA